MTNPLDPTTQYNVPKGDSKYLKFEKGQTKFMPMASAIVGFEYWTEDNKPVRIAEAPDNPSTLPGIRQEDDGRYKVSHFWAFPVIDIADGKVKVLQITQKSVQGTIREYVKNEEWGDPVQKYSFSVTREGDGFDTKYTVMANPAKELPAEYSEAWRDAESNGFDITRLLDNGDPFTPGE